MKKLYLPKITNKRALDLIKAKNNLIKDFNLGEIPKSEIFIKAKIGAIEQQMKKQEHDSTEKYLEDNRSTNEYIQAVVANHFFELKLIEAIKQCNPQYKTIYKSGTDTEGFCLDAHLVTGVPDITLIGDNDTKYYLEVQTGNSEWDKLQVKKHKIKNAEKYNNYRILFVDAFRGKYAIINPTIIGAIEYKEHLYRLGNKAGYEIDLKQVNMQSYKENGIKIIF